MREKEMLKNLVDQPFIIRLQMTYMDAEHLYFVFDHCKYGTLANLVDNMGGLKDELVRHYTSEIVEALCTCADA